MTLPDVTRTFLIAAGLFLAALWLAPGGVYPLRRRSGEWQVDVRAGYDATTLYRLLDAYGEAGRRGYRRMLMLDLSFPLVYGAAFYLVAISLGAPDRHSAVLAQGLLLLGAACDYLEDVLLLRILRRFPRRLERTAGIAGVATSGKVLALVLMLACLTAAALHAP